MKKATMFCLFFITTQAFGHGLDGPKVIVVDSHYMSLADYQLLQEKIAEAEAIEEAAKLQNAAVDAITEADKATADVEAWQKAIDAITKADAATQGIIKTAAEVAEKKPEGCITATEEAIQDLVRKVAQQQEKLAADKKRLEQKIADEDTRLKKAEQDAEEARLRAIPVIVPVERKPTCAATGRRYCDAGLAAIPKFTNLRVGTIQSGTYTITNCFPGPMWFDYIRIQKNDLLPEAATEIVSVPNSCSTSTPLAVGASCNVQVNLRPLQQGSYNRVLQFGVDSRQGEVGAPAITVSAK
jgi:hypothetical protein